MINSLVIYNKTIGQHILTSEVSSNKPSVDGGFKHITLTLKTQNEYIDFLNFYSLTGLKLQRKKFYLSASQKKYQTMFAKQAILTTKLNNTSHFKLMSYLFRFIFRDFLKQTQDSALNLKKDAFVIRMLDIPILSYNKSILFKSIFAHHINVLNPQNDVHFYGQSLSKQILYLKFFRYIVPVYVT